MERQPRVTAAIMSFLFAMELTTSVWTKVFQELALRSAVVMETCKFACYHQDIGCHNH